MTLMPDPLTIPSPGDAAPFPPRSRTPVAAATLACLAAIAGTLLWTQSHFNPAVANFLRAAAGPSGGAAPGAQAAILPLPEGVTALTAPERFDRESLSDKIDGKAELYLSAGFTGLAAQRLAVADPAGAWIEVFLYSMGSVENAYAVFSSQRRADGVPIGIAEFAYRAENAVFFVHGPTYVEMIASDREARLAQVMEELAAGFVGSQPAAPSAAIAERDLFPAEGLAAAGITLIPADAFGLEGFDRVFTAVYAVPGGEATAFLARRDGPQAAAAAAAAFAEFLTAYGGEPKGEGEPVPGARAIAIMDTYAVVFARGDFVAGVHEAPDLAQALALAGRLAARLKEAPGAR
jgi:hypothetical protein